MAESKKHGVPPNLVMTKGSKMTKERRAHIIGVLAVAIPKIAKERCEEIRKKAQYTKLCLNDAFAGRLSNGLANNSKKSKFIYTVFVIQTSEILFNLVMFSCTFHTLSIFFEPANECSPHTWYWLLQLSVFLVYFVDFGLKMTYEGVQEYFSHDWQKIYCFCACLNILDWCINGCTHWTNFMRPAAGILRARSGRRFFDVLKKMTPGMYNSLIPISFFIFVTAVASGVFFDSSIESFKDTALTSYNWFYLIFTNETYETMLPENMFTNIAYLAFFFPALYIGQRFLLSLIIGDTYETFKSFTKKQLKKERMKEMQGLTKAFTSLDERRTGMMSGVVWRECMLAYKPDIALEEIALYYELISGGNKAGISVLQFLSLSSVLAFKLQVTRESPFSVMKQKVVAVAQPIVHQSWAPLRRALSGRVTEKTQKLVAFCSEWGVFGGVNMVDIIVFSFGLSDAVLVDSLPFLTPCWLVSSFYLLEFFARMTALEFDLFKLQDGNNIISSMFILGTLGCMTLSADVFIRHVLGVSFFSDMYTYSLFGWMNVTISIHKMLILARVLRCMRTVNLNEDLGTFSAALFDVIPTLAETFIFTFLVTYIFGNMGNLLFGKWVEDWSTPLLAVNKAQQLSFMVSYIDSAEQVMEEVHPVAMVWFVFYLILSLTVANIALAIIINLHQTVLDAKSNGDRDAVKSRIDAVFQKCVDQARSRLIFSGAGQVLNFKNLHMSHFQSSSTRQFVGGDKKKGFVLEDIQKCVKYSNIDLIENFKETHRNHKDLNWELDFLKSVNDTGEIEETTLSHGTVLFQNEEASKKLYLLIRGTVLLKGASGSTNEFCFIEPTNFVGVEALRPGGVYRSTCIVEKEAVVMIFNQEDIAHKLDEKLCGRIVRMASKSQALQRLALAEARKRADTPTAYLRRSEKAAASQRRRSMQRTASERSTGSTGSTAAAMAGAINSTSKHGSQSSLVSLSFESAGRSQTASPEPIKFVDATTKKNL